MRREPRTTLRLDVLNQHLEFDHRNAVLRIFRFPSMCRLMYRDVEGTLPNRLFHENEEEHDERPPSPYAHAADMQDFLVEVLLSYRLIFFLKKYTYRTRATAPIQAPKGT